MIKSVKTFASVFWLQCQCQYQSWIYIASLLRCVYSEHGNVEIIRLQQYCLKLWLLSAGSRRLSGSKFQTVDPVTEKARRPKVLSRWHGTVRWYRLQERRMSSTGNVWDWCAAIDQVLGGCHADIGVLLLPMGTQWTPCNKAAGIQSWQQSHCLRHIRFQTINSFVFYYMMYFYYFHMTERY